MWPIWIFPRFEEGNGVQGGIPFLMRASREEGAGFDFFPLFFRNLQPLELEECTLFEGIINPFRYNF